MKNFAGRLNRLGLYDSLVFVDIAHALERSDPAWHHSQNPFILIDSLLIYGFVAEDVGESNSQLMTVGVQAENISIPLDAFLYNFLLVLGAQEGQRKHVIDSAIVLAVVDSVLIPSGDEPLIVADGKLVHAEAVDGTAIWGMLHDVLLVHFDGWLILFLQEEDVGDF